MHNDSTIVVIYSLVLIRSIVLTYDIINITASF